LITDEEKLKIAEALDKAKPARVYQQDIEHASAGLGRGPVPLGPVMTTHHDVKREGSRVAAAISKNTLDKELLKTGDGKLRGCMANALTLLRFHADFEGVLAWDKFACRVVTKKITPWKLPADSHWRDLDNTHCLDWMERQGIFLGNKGKAGDAVEAVAHDNEFHPVRDWLEGLKWDGVERLPLWLHTYFGAPNTKFVQAVSERWLISAVARIFQPGCQADSLLLLEGAQGIGKSSGLRALFSDKWFTDSISTLDNKDALLQLRGKWLAEFSELSALKGAAIEQVKRHLSVRIDNFRELYKSLAGDNPRQAIFAGTTNCHSSLIDPTGARRFWPVACGRVRVDQIKEVRGQLFAEAVCAYRARRPWHLNSAELNSLAKAETDARYEAGVWHDTISEWIEDPRPTKVVSSFPILSTPGRVLVREILLHAIGKEMNTWNPRDEKAVVACLTHLGFERKQSGKQGEKGLRFYVRQESF
jgi:predicted P-loop ATPase